MTTKADFDAQEWSTIVEGPLLAALRVVTAARGGTIRETIAMGRTYAEARQQHGESELLDELVAAPPTMEATHLGSAEEMRSVSGERLRKAVELLEQKASDEEVDAYKAFVVALAVTAAKAHREGGFMGIGGERVSESERAALDEIVATLQMSPSGGGGEGSAGRDASSSRQV